MPDLTITVPDAVLPRARIRAAREGTSVSRVLRAELMRNADEEAEVGMNFDGDVVKNPFAGL